MRQILPLLKQNLKYFSLACVIGLIVLTISTFHALVSTESGNNVPYASLSNTIIDKYRIPSNATNINYMKQFFVTRLSFTISPNDFLNWARQQNLEVSALEKFDVGMGYKIVNGSIESHNVMRGFRFDQPIKCGFSGTYNSDDNTCSATWYCRDYK